MEIELRARQKEDTKEKLLSLGATLKEKKVETDNYFKFKEDVERKLIIRTRVNDKGVKKLTFKGSSKAEDDIAWQEWETNAENINSLEKLFLSNGLVPVVSLEKKREQYTLDEFEINLDEVKNLGKFIEVELISNDIQTSKNKIQKLFYKLEIAEIDSKGYVPLMLEKNGG